MILKRKTSGSNSDEDLLIQYMQTNSSDYFGELYNRYIPLIYGVCLKYLKKSEKAKEVTLELFEILLAEVSTHEIKVFKTWIYNVTANHCLQILKREQHIPVDFDASDEQFDYVLYLLEKNVSKEKTEILTPCLEKLPKQQKTSISMFFTEKMSYADIADQTGYLLKTIKSQIQNGKKNLKNCIEKHQNE